MGVNALSLRIETTRTEDALRRIALSLSSVRKPAGIVGFVSGALASCLQSMTEEFARRFPRLPCLFAASDSVATEEGELDDQGGLACLVLGGAELGVAVMNQMQSGLRDEIGREAPVGNARTYPRMLLSSGRADLPNQHQLGAVVSTPASLDWFGAATSNDAPIWSVDTDGRNQSGSVGAIEFRGLEPPIIAGAPCCRLITPPLTISSAEGTVVLELDGVPALVALGQASSKLADRSWIVVALCSGQCATTVSDDGAPSVLFRPVRGIDPARGAIILADQVAIGTRLAFAVRDDRTSRNMLELALRATKPRLYGGSPRFGIYFDGLGRGRSLYGRANVDLGLVKQALGSFPILAMRSAVEFRSDAGSLGVQTLTGQLALFRNPS
jgi:hypothetical protein